MPCFHSVNPLLPHFKTFPFIDELILIYLSCESNPFKLGANPRILFIDFDNFSLIGGDFSDPVTSATLGIVQVSFILSPN